LLEVDGIDVSYGHIQALFGISLRVDEGELVALIGANGAGKTTTLRTISGLLRPISGKITLDGKRIDKTRPEDIVKLGVSHLPEGRGMFPNLTVEENLKMGFYIRRSDRKMWKEGVERVTALFPRLKERWTQAAGTLSGGEQQMLALSRAVLPNPRLLMVDELSLGLAPVVVQQLFQLLVEINKQGTTILLVEQYVNQALKIADRAYVLEKGSVSLEGSAKELLDSSDVVQASYMGGHAHAPGTEEAESSVGGGVAVATKPKPARSRKPAVRARRTAPASVKRNETVIETTDGAIAPDPLPAKGDE
jgi:branched-chain amino acid transport system ATP-binding protein